MSSIRRVQTERLLQDVIRTLYADGREPLVAEVATRMSRFFSNFPAGEPLPLPRHDAIAAGQSDVKQYNKLLSHLAINLDVLYETSLRQVEDVIALTSSLQSHLSRLKAYRGRVESQIDDYLLGLYNTDGYFLSISDNFSDTAYTDLNMTSAHVDTESGVVTLPTVSNTSSNIPLSQVGSPRIQVSTPSGVTQYEELAPFTGALEDSLENIIWAFEVRTARQEEVVANVVVDVGNSQNPIELSQINFSPYGSTPVQVFFETKEGSRTIDGSRGWVDFGNKIQTGTTKMVFESEPQSVSSIRMTLRKTRADYTENINGKTFYKYIFGARSITFAHKVYDFSARHVSLPLFIPADLYGELVIDAVSVDVVDEVVPGTSIKYYVAASTGDPAEEFSELNWRSIVPVGSNEIGQKVVRFDGAATEIKRISSEPAAGDLELLPIQTTGPIGSQNPSSLIIPGVDIYRIAKFDTDVLLNSLELVEGVNTTKIYSKSSDPIVNFADINLGYWANVFEDAEDQLTVDYGAIDSGDEFFYGGDIGAIGKDIFVETFLDADRTYPTFLEEFQKIDVRSQTWDVKIYLNGRPIGHLPSGQSKAQLPWSFIGGLNHVVLLIRIPENAADSTAYLGSLSLMGSSNLYDYGQVRLSKWDYNDFFNVSYNETGQPKTFTIHNGELISRRRPTANFLLKYAKSTGKGPEAIRFRTEMVRERNTPNLSPILDSYRVRFSYAED